MMAPAADLQQQDQKMTMMRVMPVGVTGSEMGMKPKTEQQQQQLTLKQKPPTMMTTTTSSSNSNGGNTGQKTRTKKILQGLIL